MSLLRITVTPSLTNAGEYAVGDAVGGKLTFSGAVTSGATNSVLRGCRIVDKARQSVPLELWLFREDFTASTDNSAFAPSDADLANLAAVVQVSDWFHTAGNSAGQPENLPLSVALDAGDTTLYGQLVARGKPTYASGDLVVDLLIDQNFAAVARRSRRFFAPKQYPPLTAVTAITPAENYHTVHLEIGYTPPAIVPASTIAVTGSYLRKGRWVKFHPALLDAQGAAKLYTILFGLEEGKAYPVKLEFTRRTSDANAALIERQLFQRTFTTRSSPVSANASFVYIASPSHPTTPGNDTTGNGQSSTPYKTLSKAASVLGAGGTIIMKNGTYGRDDYNFDTAAVNTVSGLVGSSTAYKTIRAETEGSVVITGKKLLSGLSWTKHADFIYYADFSAFLDTASTPKRGPLYVRNELTGNGLYLYPALYGSGTISNVLSNHATYTITSPGHGLNNDEFISIGALVGSFNLMGDLNYNGLQVMEKTNDTFRVRLQTTYAGNGGWFRGDDPPMELDPVRGVEGFVVDWHTSRVYVRKKNYAGYVASSSNNGGNVQLTLAAPHSLAVGDRIAITGHTVTAYNVVHQVTAVVSNVAVKTNVSFTSGGEGGRWTCDTPPASGEYAASMYSDVALDIYQCNFLIFDGVTIEMFGKGLQRSTDITATGNNGSGKVQFTIAGTMNDLKVGNEVVVTNHTTSAFNGVHTIAQILAGPLRIDTTTAYSSGSGTGKLGMRWATDADDGKMALRFGATTDLAIRNCTFTLATCGNFQEANERITIEDCTFNGHDWWGMLVTDPFLATAWGRIKEERRNETRGIRSSSGVATQLVVRRCTFEKGHYSIDASGSSGNNNADYYDNTFARTLESWLNVCTTIDSGTGNTNSAAWHNIGDGGLYAIDALPYPRG